jgi:hypothetical protein
VQEASALLAPCGAPFWIAGGLAIDLAVGRPTRAHGDTDIAILRGDEAALEPLLDEWEIVIAHAGRFLPWDGAPFQAPHHQFWARRRGSDTWHFEVLLEEHAGDAWIYRRDARITLQLAALGRATADDVPFLAPEVALLYKSTRPDEPRSAADFSVAAPVLDGDARRWLREALAVTSPGHPWIAALRAPQ